MGTSTRSGDGSGRFSARPGASTGARTATGGPDRADERPWRGSERAAATSRDSDGDGGFEPGRGTGPRRAAGASTSFRAGAAASGTGRFAKLDESDADDAMENGTSSSSGAMADLGMGLFVRRLVIALVWLGFALALGVGAGVIWEKVRPSGDTATATPSTTSTSSAPAGQTQTQAPAPSASPTSAVPSDWVSYTTAASKAKSTFSHPANWTMREDSTGVFFGDPSGPQMIGVARRTGVDGAAALSKVQALEFGGQPGLSVTGSGDIKDPVSGGTVRELTGTYVRQGQKVSYLMRSVDATDAVYVLIARVSADADAELDSLMSSLRASFQPG